MFIFDNTIIYPKDPTATKKRIKQYQQYYKVKYDICKKYNPKIICEIGVRAGYSAWAFLQACPQALYIGIDANNGTHGGQGGKNKQFWNWAKKILEPYQTQFIELDTQKTSSLQNFLKNKIDFFHVDGDHTKEGVKHDLDLAYSVLSERGIILVDDIDYISDVKNGTTEWLQNMGTKTTATYIPSLRGELIIGKNNQ